MKTIKYLFVVKLISLFCIFLLFGCKDSTTLNPDMKSLDMEDGFAIYVFKDKSIKAYELYSNGLDFDSYIGKDVSTLVNVLKSEVDIWLSAKDIEFYEYPSHVIYLKQDKSFLFYEDYKNGESKFFFEFGLTPFIVTAGSKICYIGSFSQPVHSSFLGYIPNFPAINQTDIAVRADNVIPIRNVGFHLQDVLVSALKKDNIFKSDEY